MAEDFVVTYLISDEEWDRTLATREDPEAQPIFESFYGPVQISVRGQPLFQDGEYYMSVADLACGFADILRRDLSLIGTIQSAKFEQSDDSLTICFDREGDQLTISVDCRASNRREIGVEAFFAGANAFLHRFVVDAISHIPNALDWKDLRVLRRYADNQS